MCGMTRDSTLIQIIDTAMAEATRKSGAWVVCRPGCYQCCLGPFPITPLDALRLREGLAALERTDPARAASLRHRARHAAERIREAFPDDSLRATLETEDAFDHQPCPALDPQTGTCDLYASRPITCRTFGPAVRLGPESLAVCELCYHGATDDQIAACEVQADPAGLENELLQELEKTGGDTRETIVAFALALS